MKISEKNWAADTNRLIRELQRSYTPAKLKRLVDAVNRHTIGVHVALREDARELSKALTAAATLQRDLEMANARILALTVELESARKQAAEYRADAMWARQRLGSKKTITRDTNGQIATVVESIE